MTRTIRLLSSGHAYPEGPCVDEHGALHVVELAGGVIARVDADGRHVVAHASGAPNGAAVARDGTLFFCNNGGNWGPNASTGGSPGLGGGTPRVQALRRDGTVQDILTEIEGEPLRGPNDITIDADGGLWFTDPAWAERDAAGRAPAAASPPGGLCFVSGAGEDAVRVVDGLVFPNGLAFAPDGDLVVGETGTGVLWRYPVEGPGRLGRPSVYAELGAEAYPDGMCFDVDGTLIVAGTGSGALFVIDTAGGVSERIPMDDPDVTNVCFAGEDGRTLVVTQASTGLVTAMRWPVPGMALPGSPSPWVPAATS